MAAKKAASIEPGEHIVRTIRGLKGQGLDSWEKVAARLNEMGMKTLRGKTWSRAGICTYVRYHRLRTGERLHPEVSAAVHGKRVSSRKMAEYRVGRERIASVLRTLGGEGLDSWAKVAERLNRNGVVLPAGKAWTGSSVCKFVHSYKRFTGERLHPDVSVAVHTVRLKRALRDYIESTRPAREARRAARTAQTQLEKERRRHETVKRLAGVRRASLETFTLSAGAMLARAKGEGCGNARAMADWMNAHHVESRRGSGWSEHSVRDVGARYERLTGVRVLGNGRRKSRGIRRRGGARGA